jgi:hypothetical protein
MLVGGRVPLRDEAYAGTRTQREWQALLGRGGVIGGDSAGAEIQGATALTPPNEAQRNPAGPFRGASSDATSIMSTNDMDPSPSRPAPMTAPADCRPTPSRFARSS